MKTIAVKGVIKRQWGKDFPKVLSYDGSCQQYDGIEEVKASNDMPNDAEVVTYRNTQRVNNVRQKLMADAIADAAKVWAEANKGRKDNPYVAPTLESDEGLRVKNIVDSLKAAGKSEAEALVIAKAALGISD